MAIGSTPGGSGHVVPDAPDHPLVTPEDTVAIARMEEARFREVGTKLRELLGRVNDIGAAAGVGAAYVMEQFQSLWTRYGDKVGTVTERTILPLAA